MEYTYSEPPLFSSEEVQSLLIKAQGDLANLTNEQYGIVVSSAAKSGVKGMFDNDGFARAKIVLHNLYRNTKKKVGVYARTFTGTLSDSDVVLEGWEECLKNNPDVFVLIDSEPENYTKVFNSICTYINDTKRGKIMVTTPSVRDEIKDYFKDNNIHYFSLGDDDKVRYELDNEYRKAWCSFSNKPFSEQLWQILNDAIDKSDDFVIDFNKLQMAEADLLQS